MTRFRWSQGWGVQSEPKVKPPSEEVQTLVTRCLLLSPRTTDQIIAQLKTIEFADIQAALRQMRDAGKVACTGERWWLRGLALTELHKAQDKERRESACYCSDFNSGGVPCPVGMCPNAPRSQSR